MIDGKNISAPLDTRFQPFEFFPQRFFSAVHDHLIEIADKRGIRISFAKFIYVAMRLRFQGMVSQAPTSLNQAIASKISPSLSTSTGNPYPFKTGTISR